MDFMKEYFVNDNKTGCRFITVDAYKTAESFYLKNDFMYLSTNDENNYTRVMFYDLISLMT